ncbi:hypothetical protein BKN38_07965 [Helicobacter sp. CLO-3]|uniref:hypothetical protein n=1 Tax=unclassified Helicobacter TaxID=2593540 RepID=UPI000805A5CA|nr:MULTISPECIES: hypothetical protein [unclassified Helicobacter]OBV28666.1 hypothetical protein BA723_08640 [Helicobacter sp. CLO-3]OHU81965.1 hypothetical protein BKN38_07965 [Helicobacter sp. CLO-3]
MKHPFVIILDDATFLSRLDSADNKAYMTILKDSIASESKIMESKIAESKIMESNIATLKNTLKSLINDKVNFALLDGSKRKTIKEAYAKIWYHLELGKSTAKNTPQTIMDDVIDIDGFARKGGKALKESYAKIWHHLDLGKNEAIESYLRDELQLNLGLNLQPNPAHKDNILFSKDFVLQLKRMAAYNYSVYMSDDIRQGYDVIAGNLIYDEEFIPTTLDIKD